MTLKGMDPLCAAEKLLPRLTALPPPSYSICLEHFQYSGNLCRVEMKYTFHNHFAPNDLILFPRAGISNLSAV